MADDRVHELHAAIDREDPAAVARLATVEDLERLKSAEALFEARHQRKKRSTRLAMVAQALVGYVALAGFFANAYQNYNNKKQADEQGKVEQERWAKEFKRAQDADKYRAFFETSALATDPNNPDKRLVGYALLKEFVDDKTYANKAIFMLEEALALELRGDTGPGLDEVHRAAVVAILSALSYTSDCHALAQAARSIDRIARRRKQNDDVAEAQEVFGLYVRRLVGRAVEVCPGPKEFRDVRKPLRDVLAKNPELAALPPHPSLSDENARIAKILHDRCAEELEEGITDCAETPKAYARMCGALLADKVTGPDEAAACAVFK